MVWQHKKNSHSSTITHPLSPNTGGLEEFVYYVVIPTLNQNQRCNQFPGLIGTYIIDINETSQGDIILYDSLSDTSQLYDSIKFAYTHGAFVQGDPYGEAQKAIEYMVTSFPDFNLSDKIKVD